MTQAQSPSEILAEKISTELTKQKLIVESDLQKFIASLASGKLKSEDWRLYLENGIDREARNGK